METEGMKHAERLNQSAGETENRQQKTNDCGKPRK